MSTKAWRQAHREKLKANTRRWQLRHPEHYRAMTTAQKRRRRHRLRLERPALLREQRRRALVRRQTQMVALLTTWRAAGCSWCPERDPRCIDAHHVDPTQKASSIANLISRGKIRRLLTELEKCIPLCANCHRKHHAPQKDGFTSDTAIAVA